MNSPSKPPPQDDFVEYEDDNEDAPVILEFDDPVDANGRVALQLLLLLYLSHDFFLDGTHNSTAR